MKDKTTKKDIISQLYNSLSDGQKRAIFKTIANNKVGELKGTSIKKQVFNCPHCKSTHFVKNEKITAYSDFCVVIVKNFYHH